MSKIMYSLTALASVVNGGNLSDMFDGDLEKTAHALDIKAERVEELSARITHLLNNRQLLNAREETLLKLFRTPNYAFSLSNKGSLFNITELANVARDVNFKTTDINQLMPYIYNIVMGVSIDDKVNGLKIKDGIMTLSSKSVELLQGHVDRAFRYHCYGVLNPTAKQRTLCNKLVAAFTWKEGNLPKTLLNSIDYTLERMCDNGLTYQIGERCVSVPDFATSIKKYGGIAFLSKDDTNAVIVFENNALTVRPLAKVCNKTGGDLSKLFISGK